MSGRTIIVTGATGLLGSHLVHQLVGRGDRVIALSRTRLPHRKIEWHHYTMPGPPPSEAFATRVDAAIHCAYETREADPSRAYRVNVEGSRRFIEACRAGGVGLIVFISSLSAHEAATSAYGKSKLEIESFLDLERDLVIRPGLIVSRTEAGLFGRMRAVIRRGRIVPLPYGGKQLIQTVAIDDLTEGIARAVDRHLTGILSIAEPDGVPIKDMYHEIANACGVRPIFVPIPGAPLLVLLRVFEALGVRLPVTSENLLGLRHLRAFDVRADLELLDLRPRSMQRSVRESA